MSPDQLVASPCSNPELDLDTVLSRYHELGFSKFEVFTSWAKSAFDFRGAPESYVAKGKQYSMAFTSMHLPVIGEDLEAGIDQAVAVARFAHGLGVKVVLLKAKTRDLVIEAARPFLDRVQDLTITTTVQNHVGTAISDLADYRAVLEGVADTRLKTVLEVGMFCSVGVSWAEACEVLDGTIALVHLKDQIQEERVPFGEGDVDFAGLFAHMDSHGYDGEYVVEMEVCRDDTEHTIELLGQARDHLVQVIGTTV